jgi:putative porin
MIRSIVRTVFRVGPVGILLPLIAVAFAPRTAAAQGSVEPQPPAAAPTSAPAAPAPEAAAQEAARAVPSGWNIAGDFRLRYEDTTKQEPNTLLGRLEPRHRAVIRFRGGVTRKITNHLDFGVRIATGARGDPNTTDITLGDFVDKFEISLDRVYLGWLYKGATLYGGKFINPFIRTELVWDDDVSSQGFGGTFALTKSKRIVPSFAAVYSIVDEQTTNPDSYMAGGQMQLKVQTSKVWNFQLGGGYYDYTIKSLTHADAGDILSNRLNATKTNYLSDFNLIDVVGIFDYLGAGPRWPLRFSGNWVKNLRAADGVNKGKWVETTIGRASAIKDTRYRYGFAKAETDAFLAAFSNDNTTFATNYLQHTLAVDYVAAPNAIFNATWYIYRRNQGDPGTGVDPGRSFLSRLRLNATVSF